MKFLRLLIIAIIFVFVGRLEASASIGGDSIRSDNRTLRTRGAVEGLMRRNLPRLTFNTKIDPDSFPSWKSKMKASMEALMHHPASPSAPAKLIKRVRRENYTLEKWESYPLDSTVVPFLVLIPDNIDKDKPVPAVLCIPGFGQTKELLAGEKPGNFSLNDEFDSANAKNCMALDYVKEGLVAVAVDNPSCGELSDDGHFDYLESSRFLLECNWSYLGLSSWQDRVILNWMKEQPYINPDKIIVSGFSLGTEPLMVLGLLDDSIYAFVYNDFLCRTRERALVMDKLTQNNTRPFPNSIEHLIPGFLMEFDFPDIVAALAPRPVICTEGGLDRDFAIIATAYDIAGQPNNFEWHHYPKYSDPASRQQIEVLPSGIDRDTYFRLVNVDPPSHYFKKELVMPWIHRILSTTPKF